MASLTIKHEDINGGSAITMLGGVVSIKGKKEVRTTPDAVLDETIVEGQTVSIENPIIVVSQVKLAKSDGTTSGIFTYSDVIRLWKDSFTGSNPAYLKIVYGASNQVPDSALNTLTDGIKVLLKDFNVVFDTSDSRDAYIPMVNLTFVETKSS